VLHQGRGQALHAGKRSAIGSVARGLLRARAAAARRFSRVSGAVMMVVGAALLTETLAEAGIVR
jgi:threonine/homoserine/homoserine lactone efflux protein